MVKVLFIPLDSWGHVNSCFGIAEKLQKLGHSVTFALEAAWKGRLVSFGFDEVIYTDPQRKPNQGPNDHWIDSVKMIEDTLHCDSLYKAQHQNIQEFEEFVFNELNFDDQLAKIIDKLKPDVMVVDHYFTVPAVLKSKLKWVYMTSATPLSAISHPDTPPTGSGYPTEGDRDQWKIFMEATEQHYGGVIEKFNKKLLEIGISELPPDSTYHPSPYLNIYAYPEELDYLNIRPLPKNWKRFDHFIRSVDNLNSKSTELKIPDHFLSNPGKLIFVSMGSMCSNHLKLIKRLIDILSSSAHRYLMVLGSNKDKVELPKNIWGDRMLPQLNILQMVDLVITHGGNNSVIESMYFGKPMIISPMFYDQYDNAQRVTECGFGKRINLYTCQPEELLSMIDTILTDDTIKQRCMDVSKRMAKYDSTLEAAKAIVDIDRNDRDNESIFNQS